MTTYVRRRYLLGSSADFSEEEGGKKKRRRGGIVGGVVGGVGGAVAVGAGAYALSRRGKKSKVSNSRARTANKRTPNARMARKGKVRNASAPNSPTMKRSVKSEEYRPPAGDSPKRKRKQNPEQGRRGGNKRGR